MIVRRATRRVHLARDGLGLTVCGLVAASLGTKGVWRPSWAMTPPAWRCARCRKIIATRRAQRPCGDAAAPWRPRRRRQAGTPPGHGRPWHAAGWFDLVPGPGGPAPSPAPRPRRGGTQTPYGGFGPTSRDAQGRLFPMPLTPAHTHTKGTYGVMRHYRRCHHRC